MFPWLPTLKARSLSKSTNLAPPRIGTKQNETKRRRSNRLISDISWFWIVECWRVCQRTCTISIEEFITHTYHDLRTYGQFSDILRMRHLRSLIVCRRCTSYTYFAVSLCAELQLFPFFDILAKSTRARKYAKNFPIYKLFPFFDILAKSTRARKYAKNFPIYKLQTMFQSHAWLDFLAAQFH